MPPVAAIRLLQDYDIRAAAGLLPAEAAVGVLGAKGKWAAAAAVLAAGLALLAASAFVAAWPDMEASMFDAATANVTDTSLAELRCPVLMAADEPAAIRAALANRGDVRESFLIRARISAGFVSFWRQDSQRVTIDPGATLELSWPVTADDAAYGRVVLARVLATRGTRLPARQRACGILVMPVTGVGGSAVFAGWVLAAMTLTTVGGGLLLRMRHGLSRRQRRISQSMGVLAAVLLGALATGVAGWWLISHLALVFAGLVLAASLAGPADG